MNTRMQENQSNKIQGWLINQLSKKLKISKSAIDPSRSFTEYGVGSLQAITFSGDLSKWLGKDIPPTLLWDYDNIDKLTHYLAEESVPKQTLKRKPNKPKPVIASKLKQKHKLKSNAIENFPEIKLLRDYKLKIEKIAKMPLYFNVNEGVASGITHIKGKEFINFSSYNYLNFSGDPAVTAAAKQATDECGTSVSASRLSGGEKPLHLQLEEEISDLLGTEACVVFNSGHATNVTTIGHMFNQNDLIVCDQLGHNSLLQGAKLSGATIKFFQHNNVASLEKILKENRSQYHNTVIITEGVFSMDGDIPPLPKIIKLKSEYNALLYVDEAHSIGVLGKQGGGIRDHFDVNPQDVDFWMGTLSKAFASCGGYIAGNQALIDYIKLSAPGFVYSCGLSPANTAASLAALRQLKKNASPVNVLQKRAKYLFSKLKKANINLGKSGQTPVIPIIVGDFEGTIKLCAALRRRGIYLQAVVYPAVVYEESRLRVFVNAAHTEKQLDYAADVIIEEMQKLKLI